MYEVCSKSYMTFLTTFVLDTKGRWNCYDWNTSDISIFKGYGCLEQYNDVGDIKIMELKSISESESESELFTGDTPKWQSFTRSCDKGSKSLVLIRDVNFATESSAPVSEFQSLLD